MAASWPSVDLDAGGTHFYDPSMTQPEEPEAADSAPVIHVHIDQPTPTRARRRTVLTTLSLVVSFVLGAFTPPIAGKVVDHFDSVMNPPVACHGSSGFLEKDYGVRSDIIIMIRPSTTIGCFKAEPVHLVDGQDFSGWIEWKNHSTKQQDGVVLRLNLPEGVTLVPRTSILVTSKHPHGGPPLGEQLTTTGYNFGSYAPEGNFWVQYDLHFDAPSSMKCGLNRFALFGERLESKSSGAQLTEAAPLDYTRAC